MVVATIYEDSLVVTGRRSYFMWLPNHHKNPYIVQCWKKHQKGNFTFTLDYSIVSATRYLWRIVCTIFQFLVHCMSINYYNMDDKRYMSHQISFLWTIWWFELRLIGISIPRGICWGRQMLPYSESRWTFTSKSIEPWGTYVHRGSILVL